MSPEENKNTVRRFFEEVCNKNNRKIIREIFAENVEFNGKSLFSEKEVNDFLDKIEYSFCKPRVEIIKQFAEGDLVATFRTWTGFQIREYNNRPPTDTLMSWNEISVVRFLNDHIVEDWVVRDELTKKAPSKEKIDKDLLNFLDKDYERKINYLVQQFTRMWTRFNFFITLESSLLAGKFLFKIDEPNQALAWIGLGLSLCWYVFGANDKQLVNVYKYAVEKASEKLTSVLPVDQVYSKDKYYYVGKPDIKFEDVNDPTRTDLKKNIFHWRLNYITITHLATVFPVVLALVWVICLIVLRYKH